MDELTLALNKLRMLFTRSTVINVRQFREEVE